MIARPTGVSTCPSSRLPTIHEQRTRAEAHRAADQADDDARLGADPTAGEGQAQEEDRAEDERQATDPREGAAGQACLEVGQGDGHARLGWRPLRFRGGVGRAPAPAARLPGVDARVAASHAGSPVAVAGAAAAERRGRWRCGGSRARCGEGRGRAHRRRRGTAAASPCASSSRRSRSSSSATLASRARSRAAASMANERYARVVVTTCRAGDRYREPVSLRWCIRA